MLRDYKICFLLPQGGGGAESHLYTSALGRLPRVLSCGPSRRQWPHWLGSPDFSLPNVRSPGDLQITPFPAFQER